MNRDQTVRHKYGLYDFPSISRSHSRERIQDCNLPGFCPDFFFFQATLTSPTVPLRSSQRSTFLCCHASNARRSRQCGVAFFFPGDVQSKFDDVINPLNARIYLDVEVRDPEEDSGDHELLRTSLAAGNRLTSANAPSIADLFSPGPGTLPLHVTYTPSLSRRPSCCDRSPGIGILFHAQVV